MSAARGLRCWLTMGALLFAALPAQAQLLKVESLDGAVQLERAGGKAALAADTLPQTDDVISTDAGGDAVLRLGRHGVFEIGPDSVVTIERLPHASYADDLRTVLRLRRGYLRVIWKQPPLDVDWPLFVYLGSDRVAIDTGEYFFAGPEGADASAAAACVAEGRLAFAGAGRSGTQLLGAGACYRLAPGATPAPVAHAAVDWIDLRSRRRFDAGLWQASPPRSVMPAKPAAATPATNDPAPALPAITGPEPPRPGRWNIELGVYADAASAQDALDRARQAGFGASLREVPAGEGGDGAVAWQLAIRRLDRRETALALQARLQAAGYGNTRIGDR